MLEVHPLMDAAIDQLVQRPAFKVLSYDISSKTGETWEAIITGTTAQTPVDLTAVVSTMNWAYDKVGITLADDIFRYHPDSGDLAYAIRQGRGIRVLQGYVGVDEDLWIPIFSGIIQGAYGWSLQRGTEPVVNFTVFTRESNQAWKRRLITSKEYTVGADWGNLFYNVAQDIMLMGANEIKAPALWNISFDKNVNQIVNISPWEALTELARGGFDRIWFNGAGQLDTYSIALDRVDLTLTDDKLLQSYTQPPNSTEVINKVIVTYIDNQLTKVSGTTQSLGTANITTGFFDFETKLDVFYSDDKQQRADNVSLVVKNSINQNDLGISIGSESLEIEDEFGGQLVITVDAFVSALATAGIAAILASAFIPDGVASVAVGETIPIGRVTEAAGIVAVLIAMMILGTGVYEIVGTPYDYVFLEKQAIAMIDCLQYWEEKELEIRNEFISTEAQAHQLALTELLYHQSLANPRKLVIQDDPRIEKGDIIELSNGIKFYVENATKTIGRGGAITMQLDGFRSVV